MASVKGAVKTLVCVDCGTTFTGSLYANAKTAKCPTCKKVKKSVQTSDGTPKPSIHDAGTIALTQMMQKYEVAKPVGIRLFRNRQDIEGEVVVDTGEVFERIPAKWGQIDNELDYLSISKIQAYVNCPYKFHEQYMTDNRNIDNGNIFTWFGSILHEVVDTVETAWTSNGLKLNPLTIYDQAYQKQPLTDMGMYKEGRELILEYYRVHPIGTQQYKTIATELEWRGKLTEFIDDVPDDVKDMDFGCQFDYIGEIDEETAILKDYKSNRHPFTPYELEDSLQLQVYEKILRKLYPQYKKWITGYELFRFGWQQCPERSANDLDAIGRYVINIAVQIKHDTIWKPNLHDWCGYCTMRSKCEEYCDLMNDPQRKIDTIKFDVTDMGSINDAREKFTTIEKLVKGRKDELANMVKAHIEHSVINGEKCIIGGNEMYLQAQSRASYDYNSVKSIMAMSGNINALDQCVSINKTKLDAIAKSDPNLIMELSRCRVESYSAPYIMKRKCK